MLGRLASRSPIWASMVKNSFLLFVTGGIYFQGLEFHDKVGTLLLVEGASMRPTLNPESYSEEGVEYSDICLLQKWKYKPCKGDVVCINAPRRSGAVVKRIVAVYGDSVIPRDSSFNDGKPVTIPYGHMWVEGDNALNSIDSNHYGPVPIGMTIGRVSHIVYRQKTSQPAQYFTKIDSMIPDPQRIIEPDQIGRYSNLATSMPLTSAPLFGRTAEL